MNAPFWIHIPTPTCVQRCNGCENKKHQTQTGISVSSRSRALSWSRSRSRSRFRGLLSLGISLDLDLEFWAFFEAYSQHPYLVKSRNQSRSRGFFHGPVPVSVSTWGYTESRSRSRSRFRSTQGPGLVSDPGKLVPSVSDLHYAAWQQYILQAIDHHMHWN